MTPHTLASTSSMDNTPLSDAAASTVRGKRQSRRNSFAASANLSIVHGLPIDPDRLEMDDDDDDDLGNSSGVDDDGNFDGDIDEDSLMLDDNADGSVGEYDAESLSQHTNYKNSSTFDWELDSARIRLMAEEFERDKNKIAAATSSQPADMPASSSLSIAKNDCHLQPPGSAPLGRRLSLNVPRNKAFVRLLSLVEEDVSPLASEMEHEGHITRNIRHSNVHEWLRSSHAHHSSNSNNSNSNSQQASPLVLDDIHAPNAGSGSPLRKTARILPTRMVRENSADSGACSRDTIATPTSPASSVASSPSVLAGGAAAGSIAGMNINAGLSGQGSNRASASTGMSIITSVRSGKRKSVDDGYGSSYSCSRSPLELSPSACSPLRHPYKRQAMSPSGLRMQIAIGGKSKLISSPTLAPASSTSPQLQPQMARPVAFPIVSHNHQPLPSPSAGTCPSINNNPLFQGILYGSVGGGGSGSSGIISRARSRSGAAIGTVPGGGAVGGGLSILQANGGLSRMNLEDKMDDDDDDDDDNDDDDNDNDGV
ncbi:hypothetical protein GGI12_003441 [Dipsacomyces acuminosporus]|nr:hypothetical protein GGI12_003441 [Dipsacomyces acuminosporus]